MHELDYSSEPGHSRTPARRAAAIALTVLLSIAHLLWHSRAVAWQLWELMGGIQQQGRWTRFGGAKLAPTVPVHLPAGLVFYTAINVRGLGGYRDSPRPEGPIGLLLLLAGSVAAAAFASSLAVALLWRDRRAMGRYWWRLWGLLLGWGWVLVPAEMSWIFQWTVVY